MVGGAPITDAESIDGRPVLGYENDGWTVLLTRKEPHSLVWLGGRLTDDSPVHPVSLTKRDPLAVPMPPYVSISPATPEPDAEQKTRELQAKVLPQAAEPPPKQGSLAPVGPRFTQSNTARPCSTPTCSWRVTVTNTGTAAAPATIVASVTPGMPTRTFPLGVLKPGQSATTPVMSFPNPAPRVPGKATQIMGTYIADVCSPALHGPDAQLMPRLQTRGMDPTKSPILKQVDPAEMASLLQALDQMSREPGFDAAKVMRAAENAVHVGALPEVRALMESGRLENPEVLNEKLRNLTYEFDPDPAAPKPEPGRIGYRREVQLAAETLRRDPQARVILDGVETVNGKRYTVDVLTKTIEDGAPKTIAVQAKSVSSVRLTANLAKALRQLNSRGGPSGRTGVAEGAPPGSTRVALIYLEPYAGVLHAMNRAGLDRRITRDRNDLLPEWCVDGVPQADEVVMVNQTGTHRWTKEQFDALLGGNCT